MKHVRRLWVFSDLHLSDPGSALYHSFLTALLEPQNEEDAVIFAGDIFDLLVGESNYFRTKYHSFFEAVKALSDRGVRVFYIEGNHDFHLKTHFPNTVIFENESVDLMLQGRSSEKPLRIYVAHGDLVDQSDVGYLRLRAVFRSQPIQILSSVLPGRWIEGLSVLLSRPAEQKEKDLPEYWQAEHREKLRKTYRDFAAMKNRQGFDFVILGHCHDLDQWAPFYWNMGYPPTHRQFLYYDATNSLEKDLLNRRNFPGF